MRSTFIVSIFIKQKLSTMKTTKTFFLAATVLLLSLFATSCIPTVPGGNPTPQTDTSVVYRAPNWLVQNNYTGDSIDLDSNGVCDLRIDNASFVTNIAVTNIYSINNAELGRKDSSFGSLSGDGYNFLVNDLINEIYFPDTRIEIGQTVNTGAKNALIGFRLLQSDGYHYGWMNVKLESTLLPFSPYDIKTTLINYAYKKAPNTPILAGKY